MRTCKDKYGDFAGICDSNYSCELYENHDNCPEGFCQVVGCSAVLDYLSKVGC